MTDNKQSNFYTSYKISKPFIIFLVLFLIISLTFIGYSLFKIGESLQNVIELMVCAIGGIALILWLMAVSIEKIRNSENLSDTERLYIEDLRRLKITEVIKKYVFSNMNITDCLSFIIVMGGVFKWMFFYIFAGGTVIVFYRNDTLFSKILMLSLAVVWCPWIENLILKKINFKIAFFIKLLLTILIFSAGIISQK